MAISAVPLAHDIHAVNDVRSWLELLESEGELRRITAPVHWDVELGTVTRHVLSAFGPSLLFENIRDYERTYCRKLFTGSLGTYRRIALALGLPKETPERDIILKARELYKAKAEPKVVDRSRAAFSENVVRGSDINLYELPVPKWHHWDGGRYINTFAQVITKDPVTGVQNVGLYRGMIADKDRISTLIAPSQGWGGHYTQHRLARAPMKVAVCYGCDPLLTFLSASPVSHPGYSELDILSGFKRRPVELVRCESSDLYVPADAEMVIEGTVSFDSKDYRLEGPFAEHPGYYGGGASLKPVIQADRIYFRDDPIYQGTCESIRPGWPNEDSHVMSVGVSALAWNALEYLGIPGVTDVWMNNDGSYYMLYVQIRKSYRGQAKQIASGIWGMSFAIWGLKNVMVVEEDIDIRDPGQIEWAFCTRVNPAEGGIEIFKNHFGSVLDPSNPYDERDLNAFGAGRWARMLIDATRNWNFKRREAWNNGIYPPVCVLEKEHEDAVRARWDELGLTGIVYKPRMRIDRDEDIKYRYSLQWRPTPENIKDHG
ncbi:MAG: UbiD family decarboxylase [Candidatus Methylomirabilia bacterium]